MAHDARTELLHFVERNAFDPVMRAKTDGRSEAERRKLADLQRRTKTEIERYHHYGSAAELVSNFRRDLTSQPAKKVHAQLRSLHLPTLEDIKDEFEEKARKLGVHASS